MLVSFRIRAAQALLVVVAALTLSCAGRADNGAVSAKQAQAQQVLAQINQIDMSLNATVEMYNLANVRLHAIRGNLTRNSVLLKAASRQLKRAQTELARRLVAAYTSSDDNSTLAVLLGAASVDDLLNRLETINATSAQDTRIVAQVVRAKAAIQRQRAQLEHAQAQQQTIVAQKAAERQRIESQLAQRHRLLISIRSEITHLRVVAAARQLQLARQARARIAAHARASTAQTTTAAASADATAGVPAATAEPSSSKPTQPQAATAAPVVGISASTPEGSNVVPANTHGAVVSIAMRYLGVPYVWGGASPAGFDCSGLVMYVFAQIGIALPHSSYAQFAIGTPVSLSQLQPGDLVFFDGASHVGIYSGGGEIIHAPHTGTVVQIARLSGWFISAFAGARRI
jgi:peptidoglycan DL-endopeptidase CwlO